MSVSVYGMLRAVFVFAFFVFRCCCCMLGMVLGNAVVVAHSFGGMVKGGMQGFWMVHLQRSFESTHTRSLYCLVLAHAFVVCRTL